MVDEIKSQIQNSKSGIVENHYRKFFNNHYQENPKTQAQNLDKNDFILIFVSPLGF